MGTITLSPAEQMPLLNGEPDYVTVALLTKQTASSDKVAVLLTHNCNG